MKDITAMSPKETKIKARLEEVMESILCPVSGCWSLHGGHHEYFYDEGCECHVLEAWPVGFEEPKEPGGNGRKKHEGEICYELAEFEFGEMVKEIPVEHLHFSQRRQIFEIGWTEGGQDMELRVHIMPVEVECG